MANKELTFEEKMNKLTEIVDNLENGNLPLSEVMEKFKEGVKLGKSLRTELKNSEEMITRVIEDDGEIKEIRNSEEL